MWGVHTWDEVRNLRFRFNLVAQTDDPELDLAAVHPLKQAAVAKINEIVRDDDRVDMIVLFGSSLNMRCNKNSDIDIIIKMRDTSNNAKLDVSEKIQIACDWGCDVLWRD